MREIIELAKLIRACDKISGRKKLQKIVFILQAEGHEFPQEFGYLHYGPYSFEVRQGLDLLTAADGLIEEEEVTTGEYQQFEYRPGSRLEDFLSRCEDCGTEPPRWTDRAVELNKRPANELEALATVIYLMQRGFRESRLDARFKRLKPNLADCFSRVLPEAKRICATE